MRLHVSMSRGLGKNRCTTILQAIVLIGTFAAQGSWGQAESVRREQTIPVLASTTGENVIGAVVYVVVAFEKRPDRAGLQVTFQNAPGRFSLLAQTAIHEAVMYTARSLDLPTDSWTVALTVPYPDVIIGGDSLSGMVALCVAALAQGRALPSHTVLTSTIASDGSIAPVGAVPLKLAAANRANIRRVLVSDRQMAKEAHVRMSSSMQISSVRSVKEAFDTIMQTASTP